MEIRLNKMISDSGICSRREADKFIEEGRITINGQLPHAGQKVTEKDIVMLDDLQIIIGEQIGQASRRVANKTQELVFGTSGKTEKKTAPKAASPKKQTTASEKKEVSDETTNTTGSKGLRPGKYVKYNKYAAARHATRDKAGSEKEKETKKAAFEQKAIREAMQPKFGKSLSRSAVAQRLASAPKSAALRKTSKNNPINKAKRIAGRSIPTEE